MKRGLLITLGWLCVALGTAGIFLPLLPTTVFILIASWCFARSSTRFHSWLHSHPRLGPILTSWESGNGIPLKIKLRAITILWCSISLSIFILNFHIPLTALLVSIALGVSIYLYRLPSSEPEKH